MVKTLLLPIQMAVGWLSRRPWRILATGIVLALILAGATMVALMQPPMSELAALVRTLAVTSVLSLLLGFLLYRRGLALLPSLSLTLVMAYAWAALLTLVNVLVMARLMFVSDHDLALSIVLLLFAAIIATSYGIFVSSSVTDRLQELAQTARRVAGGDLSARVQLSGRDEVAQAGQAFNRMAEQLQQAAQERHAVEALRRDLIAWTSHDLRTPLTSVRVMVEALYDGVVSEPETVQRYYGAIRADIVALNGLIDDLFELSQLEAGGLQLDRAPHSLSDLISDTLESFQLLAAQKGIHLSGAGGEIDPVMMNPQKIGRVLSNLIGNALQYTPEGGAIDVRAWREDDGVTVTVEDSGPGFATGDLPRVFEQFYRGEEARSRKATGGAGMGMAIAQAIVSGHGGAIWAENREAGGARVRFHIPDSAATAE